MPLKFASDYADSKVQRKPVGQKLNHLLLYADIMNALWSIMDSINKHRHFI
jgi:hypothetical protein